MQFKVISLSLFSASLVLGQSTLHRHRISPVKGHSSKASNALSGTEYLDLANRLRSAGANAKLTTKRVRQPFFSIPGRIVSINDESVQVFKFTSASAAEGAAKRVAPDGMTIGTSKPSWMATPHFFKRGKLIVLYVGVNESILRMLSASLGGQFAGN